MLDKYIQLIMYSDNLFFQFFRYTIVGGLASIVDIAVFSTLTVVSNINYIVSNFIAFICGLLVNYLLCKIWVFRNKKYSNHMDFIPFAVIGIIGILISNFVLYILIDMMLLIKVFFFLTKNQSVLGAKLIAVFIVLFWNFIARKKLVFGRK